MDNIYQIKKHIDEGDMDYLMSQEGEGTISANFYDTLAGLNFDSEGSDVEFVAEWSPAVRNDKCINSKILLTHDYYQSIETAVNKLRGETKATTKILGRIKKLESSPDVAKRKVGKITVVYLDENDKPKNVSVQLEKSDYLWKCHAITMS